MGRRRTTRFGRWGVIFAAAALVRLGYWALVTPQWAPDADANQYVRLGRTLAAGDGFSLIYPQMELHASAFRPPLYPAMLAVLSWVFGEALWPARLLSVVIGSAVVVLAGVLAARIGGRLAGLATAGAVAVYPPLLANDTITLTEPLALALLLVGILLIDEGRWPAAAAVTGLLLLTRPNGYLVVVLLALWVASRCDARRAVGFAVLALLVVVPWSVRNYVQVGTWRPTTSDGFTIAAVYGLPSQRLGHFVDPATSAAYGDAAHRLARFDEAGWNRSLTEEGLDGARANPDYVWYMVRRNFRGYFELTAQLNRYPERVDGRDWKFRRRTRPLFFVVTALGLVGLARHRRDRRVMVLAAITAQFVVLSLLLVAPPRLRAPFDLTMCIGLGLQASAMVSGFRPRHEVGDVPLRSS